MLPLLKDMIEICKIENTYASTQPGVSKSVTMIFDTFITKIKS